MGQLQSLDQITELPGVAADEDFFQELEAKRGFFSALRYPTCHSLLSLEPYTNVSLPLDALPSPHPTSPLTLATPSPSTTAP